MLKWPNNAEIMFETKPRNKFLADILYKCALVEQFGNGVNLMYKNQLSLGKNPPNFGLTSSSRVVLELDGIIQDVEFAKYVLRVAETKHKVLDDEELILLNQIKSNRKVKSDKIPGLLEMGLIEKVKFNKYMLSKQYYTDTNQQGKYTKNRGLSTNKNKELILQHLRHFGSGRRQDFAQIFTHELSDRQLRYLLEELKHEGKIYYEGKPKSSKGLWKLGKKTQ